MEPLRKKYQNENSKFQRKIKMKILSIKTRSLFFVLSWLVASPVFASVLPSDIYFSDQWYLQKIQAPVAWQTTTGSADVVVAILDTGFDLDHPDLVQNTWVNPREVPKNGVDDDLNGFVDDVYGWDFVDQDDTPVPTPFEVYDEGAVSHGTIIAGMIGATTNNEVGIAGISWKVKLMSVRILDNMGIGNSLTAKEGIDYAVKNGAKIINLSFTGFDDDPQLEAAIQAANKAGVLIVAAVGNTKDGGINVDDVPIYPACDGHGSPDNGIIGVASSDEQDGKSTFSNYGATCTDLSAPGEMILSTVYQNDQWTPFKQGFYQDHWSGTSMATPIVSGAAALVLAKHPTLKPEHLKNVLRLSADPMNVTGPAQGKVGAGRVNIAKALALADELYPAEAVPGSLIKLSCVAKSDANDPCKAVYFFASDGKRHAFPNDKVFFTWFKDFSSVKEVSPDFLAAIPLGKNVTYHPGTKLVKFQTVPIVYAVDPKGVLRPLSSESIAVALYGNDWNKKVDDISDVFFGNYSIGPKIDSPYSYSSTIAIASVIGLDENF
jgi:subtilisin family serine protease